MVPVQYPYLLQIKTAKSAVKGPDGGWIDNPSQWIDYSKCRDEDGRGKSIALTDGKSYSYTLLIQMPKGVAEIPPTTEFRIMDGDKVRATGNIIYSRKDQLHTRAWV